MSAVSKPRKLTVAEYLAIEATATHKSEFYDGEMFPVHPPAGPRMMAGASRFHNVVFRNLFAELAVGLKAGPCQLFAADQRVKLDPTGLWCYPDLLIVCGEPEYAADDPDALTNPRVVIEVLSDPTERYDRATKFRHYKALASVQEYVLVAQDEPRAERFVRQPDGAWGQTDFVGVGDTLALASVPAAVPLAEVYRGGRVPGPAPRRPADPLARQQPGDGRVPPAGPLRLLVGERRPLVADHRQVEVVPVGRQQSFDVHLVLQPEGQQLGEDETGGRGHPQGAPQPRPGFRRRPAPGRTPAAPAASSPPGAGRGRRPRTGRPTTGG